MTPDGPGAPWTDDAGRRWTTRWAVWATPAQVERFVRRPQPVLLRSVVGERWLDAASARRWWAGARHHFAVPGRSAAVPDEAGFVWAAHLWRSDDGTSPARLLVVEASC